jgi:hypothetical protein
MEKGNIDFRDQVNVVSDLLNKQREMRSILDTRANIMIGFNSGLILFLVNYRNANFTGLSYAIALVTLLLSLLSAVLAVKPPQFLRKKGQDESFFYHNHIGSSDYKSYKNEVFDILGDKDKICESYILETYNMTKYSNQPKKFYAHLAIRILISGVCATLFIYVLQKFMMS